MLLRDLQRFVCAFLDCNRRHDNHKFGEAVVLVQLEDRAQIHIGLARSGLHFNGEVPTGQFLSGAQAVLELHLAQVLFNFLIHQQQSVTDTELAFFHTQ